MTLDQLLNRAEQYCEAIWEDSCSIAWWSDFTTACEEDGIPLSRLMELVTDETLMLAVQRMCCHEAFTELFITRYGNIFVVWFRRFGRRRNLTISDDQVADLLQQLYLKFLTLKKARFDSHRTNANLCGFFFRICSNLFSTVILRPRAFRPLDENDERLVLKGLEEELNERELRERLHERVSQLPEQERQVMELHLEDYSRGEIAERLGWPLHRVDRYLFQARRKLEGGLGL